MSNNFDVLIKGGMVVTGAGMVRADLGIRGEKIVELGADLDAQRSQRTIDATGKYVLPGIIDVHTHPVYLDDLGGISVTGAHGGVTTMIHYAYARPGMKLLETLAQYRSDAGAKSVLDFALHGGLFDVEHQLADVPAAFKMGVTSFKVFMTYAKLKWMTDDYWLTALMDVVAQERGMVAVHAENGLATDYLEDKYLREGRSPVETFTAMRPDLLEAEALNRAMSLAQVMGCPLYVPHNSAAACLEPLRRAQANGWRVYGETCPQYLTLTQETTARVGPLAKIGPPLRTEQDNEALWQGSGRRHAGHGGERPRAEAQESDRRFLPGRLRLAVDRDDAGRDLRCRGQRRQDQPAPPRAGDVRDAGEAVRAVPAQGHAGRRLRRRPGDLGSDPGAHALGRDPAFGVRLHPLRGPAGDRRAGADDAARGCDRRGRQAGGAAGPGAIPGDGHEPSVHLSIEGWLTDKTQLAAGQRGFSRIKRE